MKLKRFLNTLIAWTAAVAIGDPTAQPDPSQVAIAGLTYGGRGCPPDTVGLALSQDKTAMIILLDEFIVTIGPGIPLVESYKQCQLSITLQHASGFQYTPVSGLFTTNGYLDEGVTARLRSSYFFSGQDSSSVPANCSVSGPIISDSIRCDTSEVPDPAWSPFGLENSTFTLSTQIRLISTRVGATGLLEPGSWHDSFQYPLSVLWRECEGL